MMNLKKYFNFINLISLIALCSIFYRVDEQFSKAFTLYANNVSIEADPYSEKNAISAAESYVRDGFFKNYGLPNIGYGKDFNTNRPWLSEKAGKENVYTHYPPGPDFMAGVLRFQCGFNKIYCMRIFPIIVGIISILLSYYFMKLAFGTVKASIFIILLMLVPMTTNMMHGLHYQGYSMSLILLQFSYIFYCITYNKLTKRNLIVVFLLSFIQGWLSFDFSFIVVFSVVPFLFLVESKNRLIVLFKFGGVCFIGFTSAHLIHWLQVVMHLGWEGAIQDFLNAASHRYDYYGHTSFDAKLNPVYIFYRYIIDEVPKENYLNISIYSIILTSLVVGLFSIKAEINNFLLNISIFWTPSKLYSFAIITALIVSSMWILVMRYHAYCHFHFIPRHFIVVYYFVVLYSLKFIEVKGRLTN